MAETWIVLRPAAGEEPSLVPDWLRGARQYKSLHELNAELPEGARLTPTAEVISDGDKVVRVWEVSSGAPRPSPSDTGTDR